MGSNISNTTGKHKFKDNQESAEEGQHVSLSQGSALPAAISHIVGGAKVHLLERIVVSVPFSPRISAGNLNH